MRFSRLSAEVSEDALDLADYGGIIYDNGSHGLVLRGKIDLTVSPVEGLDGGACLDAVDKGDHDLAVSGFAGLLD